MNSEILNKIITLRNELEEAEKFIPEAPDNIGFFNIYYGYADKKPIKKWAVHKPIFEKMLEIYCNQLKQELKELGYEP